MGEPSGGEKTAKPDTLTLFCWIQDDDPQLSFIVNIGRTETVAALRVAIKNQKSVELAAYDANTLRLWPVSIPINEHLPKAVGDLMLRDDSKLKTEDYMSEIFLGVPFMKHVHVVVRLPHAANEQSRTSAAESSKRNNSEDSDGSEGPERKRAKGSKVAPDVWMRELHRTLWNKPEMRTQIYREVTLTFEDFVQLERILDAKFPDRDNTPSSGLRADEIKREFLNKVRNRDAAGGGGGSTSLGGGDPEKFGDLKKFFPLKVEYIDLSILGLKFLHPRCPLSIFIRKEYAIISDVLESRGTGRQGSAVVSGQPGIGKTTYLYQRLIDRLLAGMPTYFQTVDGDVFYFSDEIKFIDNETIYDVEVDEGEALVDGDQDIHKPRSYLTSIYNIKVILASSPKVERKRRWLKQLGDGVGQTYIMDLWEEAEFTVAGFFFYPWDIPPCRLKEAKLHFGLNARQSWDASRSNTTLNATKESVRTTVRQMPAMMSLRSLLDNTTSGSVVGISHTVFELKALDAQRLFASARQKARSAWVMDLVLTQYEEDQKDAARLFYEHIKQSTSAATMKGIIWEREVHKYFQKLRKKRDFKLISLEGYEAFSLKHPGNVTTVKYNIKTLSKQLQENRQKARYFQPIQLNSPAVDSLFYTKDILYCLQITAAVSHPIAVSGLVDIQECLKLNSPLAALRPSPADPWPFVFVVPKGGSFSHTPQTLEGGAPGWADKIHQFVLELSEDDVWHTRIAASA
ncbi:hypothetical protein BD410DRAFT_783297 [Rickenella mellea]|uniref:Crinkler effector protein N-terminal domain-containing protein n=1 Tax=Rickenella mellea TaxID=50990 RepID=A0A4Y7QJN7_9AGAM|nr:hypothetical protein BD410DRAFT_783297 [Rickenella mellea]